MWHWFLALRLKPGTEQTMKLLPRNNHLEISVMCLALCLSNLCSPSIQNPGAFPSWGKREEKRGLRAPLTHHFPHPGFAYWALKGKLFKAFPWKWNMTIKTLFFFWYVLHQPLPSPAKKSALPGGRAAEMFPSAMTRMSKVLGWWLIFHAQKYHDFEIPFCAYLWEAGKKRERKSLCIGEKFFSFLCFRRRVKQSCDILLVLLHRGITQNQCSHLFRLEKAL